MRHGAARHLGRRRGRLEESEGNGGQETPEQSTGPETESDCRPPKVRPQTRALGRSDRPGPRPLRAGTGSRPQPFPGIGQFGGQVHSRGPIPGEAGAQTDGAP